MPPPLSVSPPCARMVPKLPSADRFAQPATVKLLAVLSTGALVVIWLVLAVPNEAAPPDHVTLVAVPVLPLPEVSSATVPPSAFSGHAATGRPADDPKVVEEVWSPCRS